MKSDLAIARALVYGAVLTLCACEQRMNNQPRYETYEAAAGFPGNQSALPAPANTVAYAPESEQLARSPDYRIETLIRGRERYAIFCVPCHGASGYGNGPGVLHGFPEPPSFHEPRLVEVEEAYFVEVITEGYGVMYSYAERIPPSDRWAIAVYIRSLQLSRQAPLEQFPEIARQLEARTQ
ncbi:MAG: cytochrome c [Pseudohongiellaceae bacterium]